ncbi:RNA-binding protein 15 [Exaiptasia diaphana]|uniref:RNA-binding protein 15B n=1 Tax=Exaiptasia diaphana TaxID=2652724 RepID=A0A913XVY6_EXADI|nr:RNA-binding protein 15 [Exaiptasia diaphana]KXJ24586.1 putative RNA-binding protein 15B [Exaiptasia diaphana]
MVMKRSSEPENHVKSKRSRSRIDLDDNGIREHISSPESMRDSGSPVRRSSSLTRKTDERTYKRTSNVNMRNDSNYPIHQKRERELDPHVRITNLSSHISDQQMKDALFHEFKKFGEITVLLYGRGNDRYAVVYFRTLEDAREAKRVFERRGRVMIFDRPIRIEYRLYPERTSSRRSYSPVGENFRYDTRRSMSPPRRTQRASNPQFESFERSNRTDYDRRNRGGDFYVPPQQEYIPPEEDPKATRTLFVGNLETSVSSQELRRAFEKFGVVLDVDIKRPARGQGNTYAFVKFADLDVAAKAKVDMQGEYIGRNRVKIGYGRSQQTTRLWVGGLGSWTSLTELEREFDRFGAIRRIDYRKGDDHAYILYDSLDAASVAAREMRGFQMGDCRLRIDFADKDQGLKDYDPYYQDRRDSSPSRGRVTEVNRGDNLYNLSDRDYRDDNSYLDPKQEHYRRGDRRGDEENSYRNWKENDNYSSHRDVNRSEDNAPRQKPFEDWSHDRGSQYNNDDDWDRRNQERTSKASHYRRRGPQTPPNDFSSFENSPAHVTDEERTHKHRGSSYRTKRYKENDAPAKSNKYPRTRSPSPTHGAHPQSISPDARRHSESSSDSHFSHSRGGSINVAEDDDKHKSSDERSSNKKTRKDKEPRTKDQKPATETQTPASSGTENLQDLAKRFAVAWKGSLILKNSAFPVRMHLVGGNPEVADSLRNDGSSKNALRITQRLRLDQPKLEEVSRRINTAGAAGHCLLLALPGAQTQALDVKEGEDLQQRPLRNLMSYLKQKQAAGVINLPTLQSSSANAKDDLGVLHAFPPCQFSHEHLLRIAPHLPQEPSKEDHLVILLVRGSA